MQLLLRRFFGRRCSCVGCSSSGIRSSGSGVGCGSSSVSRSSSSGIDRCVGCNSGVGSGIASSSGSITSSSGGIGCSSSGIGCGISSLLHGSGGVSSSLVGSSSSVWSRFTTAGGQSGSQGDDQSEFVQLHDVLQGVVRMRPHRSRRLACRPGGVREGRPASYTRNGLSSG